MSTVGTIRPEQMRAIVVLPEPLEPSNASTRSGAAGASPRTSAMAVAEVAPTTKPIWAAPDQPSARSTIRR